MKKIIASLCLAASIYAAGGQADGIYSSKRINIRVAETQGALQFSLLGAGSGSMSSACDLTGVAIIQSATSAIFKTSSDMGGCTVSFDLSQPGNMIVRSKGCQMFCTDRSSFDGEYKKTR